MPRRVLTRETIDELLTAGTQEVRLNPGDIVTALAKEYAQERGVRLVPAQDAAAPTARPAGGAPAAAASPSEAGMGDAVRKAVVAALGYEPDGLDNAIGKALKK